MEKSKELFLLLIIISGLVNASSLDSSVSVLSDKSCSVIRQKKFWYDKKDKALNNKLYKHLLEISDSLRIPAQNNLRKIPNAPLSCGEKLVYEIKFGFLKAGVGILEIPDIVSYKGTSCYRIISKAISNDFVSSFYPVNDIIMSIVDTAGFYPLQFEKHLSEGKYRKNYWTLFDQKNHKAYRKDTSFVISEYTHDIISALYFLRTVEFVQGKNIIIKVHTDKKTYPLVIKYLKREKIKVLAGTFNCVVVEPMLKGEGLFKQKGRLKVWISDDDQKIPVRMKSKIYFVGSITADLINYK